MNRFIVGLLCGAVLLAIVPAGVAAAKGGGKKRESIGAREHQQRVRIKEGVKSGQITRPEAKRLKAEEKAFRAEVKAAKANGKITPEERARFETELNGLNGEINAQKHDAQKRN
jgi:uncharacterized membrane protein YebE (DUF533 family)